MQRSAMLCHQTSASLLSLKISLEIRLYGHGKGQEEEKAMSTTLL
jgi:hypothetical protein